MAEKYTNNNISILRGTIIRDAIWSVVDIP